MNKNFKRRDKIKIEETCNKYCPAVFEYNKDGKITDDWSKNAKFHDTDGFIVFNYDANDKIIF